MTSLDSLSRLGFSLKDQDVGRAVDWFRNRQRRDGSFELAMRRGISDRRLPFWLGLALCSALRRLQAAE